MANLTNFPIGSNFTAAQPYQQMVDAKFFTSEGAVTQRTKRLSSFISFLPTTTQSSLAETHQIHRQPIEDLFKNVTKEEEYSPLPSETYEKEFQKLKEEVRKNSSHHTGGTETRYNQAIAALKSATVFYRTILVVGTIIAIAASALAIAFCPPLGIALIITGAAAGLLILGTFTALHRSALENELELKQMNFQASQAHLASGNDPILVCAALFEEYPAKDPNSFEDFLKRIPPREGKSGYLTSDLKDYATMFQSRTKVRLLEEKEILAENLKYSQIASKDLQDQIKLIEETCMEKKKEIAELEITKQEKEKSLPKLQKSLKKAQKSELKAAKDKAKVEQEMKTYSTNMIEFMQQEEAVQLDLEHDDTLIKSDPKLSELIRKNAKLHKRQKKLQEKIQLQEKDIKIAEQELAEANEALSLKNSQLQDSQFLLIEKEQLLKNSQEALKLAQDKVSVIQSKINKLKFVSSDSPTRLNTQFEHSYQKVTNSSIPSKPSKKAASLLPAVMQSWIDDSQISPERDFTVNLQEDDCICFFGTISSTPSLSAENIFTLSSKGKSKDYDCLSNSYLHPLAVYDKKLRKEITYLSITHYLLIEKIKKSDLSSEQKRQANNFVIRTQDAKQALDGVQKFGIHDLNDMDKELKYALFLKFVQSDGTPTLEGRVLLETGEKNLIAGNELGIGDNKYYGAKFISEHESVLSFTGNNQLGNYLEFIREGLRSNEFKSK